MNNNNIIAFTILSTIILSGCASNNDDAIKKHSEQINQLNSKIKNMNDEIVSIESSSKSADSTHSKVLVELKKEQNAIKNQLMKTENSYAIQENDTLYSLANKFNTTTENLLELNPQITSPNRLLIGHIINVR